MGFLPRSVLSVTSVAVHHSGHLAPPHFGQQFCIFWTLIRHSIFHGAYGSYRSDRLYGCSGLLPQSVLSAASVAVHHSGHQLASFWTPVYSIVSSQLCSLSIFYSRQAYFPILDTGYPHSGQPIAQFVLEYWRLRCIFRFHTFLAFLAFLALHFQLPPSGLSPFWTSTPRL